MKKISCLPVVSVLTIALMASCNSNKSNQAGVVEYDSITSELFIPDGLLVKPMALTPADNSLVIVNTNDADTFINVFSLEGKPIAEYLTKGEGPLEALWIAGIQYDESDNSIYVSYLDKKLLYHISNYNSKSPDVSVAMSYKFDLQPDSLIIRNGQLGRMANGRFIAANASTSGMIAEFNANGMPVSIQTELPDKSKIDEKLTDQAQSKLSHHYLRVSPDGKFAAVTYDLYGRKTFLNLNDDQISYNVVEGEFPNDLFIMETADLVQAFVTPKTKIYTLGTSISNNYLYQLYLGLPNEEIEDTDFCKDTKHFGSNRVLVFDKQGNLVKELTLDKYVTNIGISPDDKFLYAITESSEDGYSILRFAL